MLATQSGTGITGVGIGVVSTAIILCQLALWSGLPRVHSGVLHLHSPLWEDGLGVSARVW